MVRKDVVEGKRVSLGVADIFNAFEDEEEGGELVCMREWVGKKRGREGERTVM